MAKLILRAADGDKEFSLDETGSLTIGRSPDCDITIDDTQASRRHCSVVKLQSGYEVADLGSTNGTLVNSTLVKKQRLKHGDVIRIGAVEIVYDDPSAAAARGEATAGFLVYARGDRKGEKIELTGQRTTIGRKPTNTVVLSDAVSSSYHCEIVRDLNGYTLRDLGSTNGTLVNGEMITEAQLTHGARIRIGNTRFVFQDPAMAEIDLELAGAEDEDEWASGRGPGSWSRGRGRRRPRGPSRPRRTSTSRGRSSPRRAASPGRASGPATSSPASGAGSRGRATPGSSSRAVSTTRMSSTRRRSPATTCATSSRRRWPRATAPPRASVSSGPGAAWTAGR